jgi:hypothetical protein
MARQGKIARLPGDVRADLNQRLYDGHSADRVLRWLNALPQTKAVIQAEFNGDLVTPQNLSDWRKGGYQDWISERQEIAETKELAVLATQIADGLGGSVSDATAAIFAGRLLPLLRHNDDPEVLASFSAALNALTQVDRTKLERRKADQRDSIIKQKDETLELEKRKFRLKLAEALVDYIDNERARQIAASPDSRQDKVKALLAFMDEQEK